MRKPLFVCAIVLVVVGIGAGFFALRRPSLTRESVADLVVRRWFQGDRVITFMSARNPLPVGDVLSLEREEVKNYDRNGNADQTVWKDCYEPGDAYGFVKDLCRFGSAIQLVRKPEKDVPAYQPEPSNSRGYTGRYRKLAYAVKVDPDVALGARVVQAGIYPVTSVKQFVGISGMRASDKLVTAEVQWRYKMSRFGEMWRGFVAWETNSKLVPADHQGSVTLELYDDGWRITSAEGLPD